MHELSLAAEILRLVQASAAREPFARVARLRLEAGALAGVEVRALRFALAARDRADTATRQAVVRQLAAQAALQPLGRADTAARMSLAASALAPTPAERSATLVDHWARFPLLARLHRLGPAQALAFDRAGQRAISLDDRPQVHLWDLASDAAQGPAGALASAVAIAPDGSFAAWSDARGIGADITVWDLAGARVRSTDTGAGRRSAAATSGSDRGGEVVAAGVGR